MIFRQEQQLIGKNTLSTCYYYSLPSDIVPASYSSLSVQRKSSPVKTDHTITRVVIDAGYFTNAMCSGYPYKILETKCSEQNLTCHTYFIETGKSFLMDC